MAQISENTFTMYFPLNVILEEAYKQTSLMGKRFDPEAKNYLLEQVQINSDNREIFDTFVEQCMYNIVEKLSAFICQPHSFNLNNFINQDIVFTSNGVHTYGYTQRSIPLSKNDEPFLFLTHSNTTFYLYERNLLVHKGDVVKNANTGKTYLTLSDSVVISTADALLNETKFREIPQFDIIAITFTQKYWFNERMIPAMYTALKSAFVYYVLYKWLLLGGYGNDAQIMNTFYAETMNNAHSRANTQKIGLKRSYNLF